MFYSSAYTLRIASDFPLPELQPAAEGGDVSIRLLPETSARNGPRRSIRWEPAHRRASFDFPVAGAFLVHEGRRILVMPQAPADFPLLRLYIQGMILAALLDQRGFFVTHASVIEIGGRAVAFVGPVGAGKSTLAAALYARGYRVVADDNAAVDLEDRALPVLPAFPNLKVYPEIARVLGYDLALLRVMHTSQQKQAAQLKKGFVSSPVPLDRIYLLDREAPTQPVRLSPIQSVTEMVRHSVPTRWGVPGDGAHLAKCAQLAGAVPMYRIRTFSRLGEIATVVSRIEDHACELASATQPAECFAWSGGGSW